MSCLLVAKLTCTPFFSAKRIFLRRSLENWANKASAPRLKSRTTLPARTLDRKPRLSKAGNGSDSQVNTVAKSSDPHSDSKPRARESNVVDRSQLRSTLICGRDTNPQETSFF